MDALNRRLEGPHLLFADPGTRRRRTSIASCASATPSRACSSRVPTAAWAMRMPAVVGGWFAAPDTRPIGLFGDGSFGMSVGELETIVRLQGPGHPDQLQQRAASAGSRRCRSRAAMARTLSVDFSEQDASAHRAGIRPASRRAETVAELEAALDVAFAHPGPVFIDVVVESVADVVPPVYKWLRQAGVDPLTVAGQTPRVELTMTTLIIKGPAYTGGKIEQAAVRIERRENSCRLEQRCWHGRSCHHARCAPEVAAGGHRWVGRDARLGRSAARYGGDRHQSRLGGRNHRRVRSAEYRSAHQFPRADPAACGICRRSQLHRFRNQCAPAVQPHRIEEYRDAGAFSVSVHVGPASVELPTRYGRQPGDLRRYARARTEGADLSRGTGVARDATRRARRTYALDALLRRLDPDFEVRVFATLPDSVDRVLAARTRLPRLLVQAHHIRCSCRARRASDASA